jgi:hypothetical protein
MQVAADTVVFLTGMPIAGGLIVDGLGVHRGAEIAAGLVVAAMLGAPSLLLAVRAWLRRGADVEP